MKLPLAQGFTEITRKLRKRAESLLPVDGFYFDRPLVVLESDDWGRVGLRDQEGLQALQSAGIEIGERPYDSYTLETAEDVSALRDLLRRHSDSSGQSPPIGMNFLLANLDFARMEADDFREILLLPLSDGLPRGWSRPGLREAYLAGINEGLFRPALHGMTHFCRAAVEREMARENERCQLLRTFWRVGTPYIHWRMPWIGYEYWDAEQSQFLPEQRQKELIGQAVGAFAKMFSILPRSACAPGYRANENTHGAWAQFGIQVAQNGPGTLRPPHFDRFNLLQLYRSVEFEPAVNPSFSVTACLRAAGSCFERSIPAIVSVHSINFHSSVRDFQSRTLELLDEFLTALENRYPDLLYVDDESLWELVNKGHYENSAGIVRVKVTKARFRKV